MSLPTLGRCTSLAQHALTVSLLASPAFAQVVGAGCPGSNGTTPFMSGPATIGLGSTVTATANGLPPNIADAVLMMVGVNSVQATVPLNVVGMPGCTLLHVPNVFVPVPKFGTQALFTIQVSQDPVFVGSTLKFQAFAFDRPFPPGVQPNPFGAITSDMLITTINAAPLTRTVSEEFDSNANVDTAVSSADLGLDSTGGYLGLGDVGGTGIHGAFDLSLFPVDPEGARVWDTDQPLVIPSSNTLLDQGNITIFDGNAEFSEFSLPPTATFKIVGSKVPVIRVSGEIVVAGEIDVSGSDSPPAVSPTGGPGGAGGAGGGAGGRGADAFLPAVPPAVNMPTAANSGDNGDDAMAPASSGYAGMVGGTGGQGAPLWPASGLHTDVDTLVSNFYSGKQITGGGGGGYSGAGGVGTIPVQLVTPTQPGLLAPPALGGASVPFMLPPAGVQSLDHFAVGGSGGGGGGSVSTLVRPAILSPVWMRWIHGFGGGGGGGVVALRVGGQLTVSPGGSISARGGDGAESLNNTFSSRGTSAAGGGSGGSVLLQVDGNSNLLGTIDVSGGDGGVHTASAPGAAFAESRGGDGSHGFVRLERSFPLAVSQLGTVLGPPTLVDGENTGMLFDRDPRTMARSNWFFMPASLPRTLLRYEIHARIDGAFQLLTDNPSGPNPANVPGNPVQIFLQGADVDPGTLQPLAPPAPWVDNVTDLGQTSPTGFRFILILDRTLANDIRIDKVDVIYNG